MNEQCEALLREVKKLHERNELSRSIGPDYFEPGMMEYLDQSDGSFDPDTGSLMLRFEARGTRYDGRTEVIETVHLGDPVQISRDKENPYNANNFTLLTTKGKNIGNMPAELCNVLATFYDSGTLNIRQSQVSYVEPLSKRNRHAKQAVLFVSLEADVLRSPDQEAAVKKSSSSVPSEEFVLSALKKRYPNGVVFHEEYNLKNLGAAVHHGVFMLAKEAGVTSPQWLEQHGFQWRETGFVEADMQELDDREIVHADAVELSNSILRKYPLIGQYEASAEEFDMLFSAATECVRKICREGSSLTRREELVLTVATVVLLKKWNTDDQDDSQDQTFWNYIYRQYGFNPENSKTAQQRVYSSFRKAISGTLELYHRFLAPSNTMRYYTSMLLHAITPKSSIDSLFEILFDFYVKNLDFQYVSEDTSYKMLVKGMQARWTSVNSEVHLKSTAVMSGLKTLFLERPGYMAVLCDGLVEKLDRLLRGESIEIKDRWDSLLADWYQRKSSMERSLLQGRRREHRVEFVATTKERISVQYHMENGRVGLSVPQIRLPSTGESRPVLTIWQGERKICRLVLSVTGTDLCLTTRKKFIPLEDTDFNFSEDPNIRTEIEYEEEIIYNSSEELKQQVICFDQNGVKVRTVKSGTAYLFAADFREFFFSEESGVTMENHPGQLYRVNLDTVGTVMADGMEIFADEKQVGKPRIYPSLRPVQGIELSADGKDYRIFNDVFSVRLHIPESENPLRYQLTLDGRRLVTEEAEIQRTQTFRLPVLTETRHTIRLVDLLQSGSVFEYSFIILPEFFWETEKPWYLETENEVKFTLNIGEKTRTLTAFREPESNVGSAPAGHYSYEIDIPTLSCRLGKDSAFRMPNRLWYEEIGKETFLQLSLPAGWRGQVMLNAYALKPNAEGKYELGNLVHSGRSFQVSETLWLSLISPEGKAEHVPLSIIHFSPGFVEDPLAFQVNELQWLPQGRYIGEEGARFRLEMEGTQNLHFDELETCDKLLCQTHDISHGRYRYRVYMKKTGLFAGGGEQLIFSGEIIIGDENEFRFDGKELHLISALYWDVSRDELVRMEMRPGTAILKKLRYIGSKAPEWEPTPLPGYEAVLEFETENGRRIPFNADPANKDYICTNPVRVWIVNEHRMILATVDEEVVYFDTATAYIPNRDPERTMTKAALRARLRNPDYFDYETKGERYV